MLESLFKRFQHKCFPVHFARFLRTPYLQNNSGRLVLNLPLELNRPEKNNIRWTKRSFFEGWLKGFFSSLKFIKFHRKIPVLESLYNSVAGLCQFIKKRLQQSRCFSMKFDKFLTAPFLKNSCKWLLLDVNFWKSSSFLELLTKDF